MSETKIGKCITSLVFLKYLLTIPVFLLGLPCVVELHFDRLVDQVEQLNAVGVWLEQVLADCHHWVGWQVGQE